MGTVTPTTAEVIWQDVPNAQQYRLTITGPNGQPQTVVVPAGTNVNNYVFENLTPGTTYTVDLTAVTPGGDVPLGTLSPTTPSKRREIKGGCVFKSSI